MKRIAIIPARGGSKGLIRKNLALLNNHPLIAYSICCGLSCGVFETVVVATDDNEIEQTARSYGADIVRLPEDLTGDTSSVVGSIQHTSNEIKKLGIEFDEIVLLQCTSPFRTVKNVLDAIAFREQTNGTSFISVSSVPGHYHPMKLTKIDHENRLYSFNPTNHEYRVLGAIPKNMIRQNAGEKATYYNGAIYITPIKVLMNENNLFGKDPYGFVIDENKLPNIDDIDDLHYAEYLMKKGDIKLDFELKKK